MATMENNSGQRVVKINSLRILVMVWKPISGRNNPKASSAVIAASRKAPAVSIRTFSTPSAMSDFLNIWPAEQALRQEDQRNGEHRERGDVLVVDRKISR